MKPESATATKEAELFYSVLKSLDSFNEIEIKGVISGLLSTSSFEVCKVVTYYRAPGNVTSLIELNGTKHFQALGMLARNLFELAVDLELMELIPGAELKMMHFNDLERLKLFERTVQFKDANEPGLLKFISDTTAQQVFIASEGPRINRIAKSIWPNQNLNRLSHWSGMSMPQRVKKLDIELQEMYACFYARLSWNVHAGVQGTIDLKVETFTRMCALSYHLAARVYEIILLATIKSFKLSTHDPAIENKMTLARYLPFTRGQEDEAELMRDLNLYRC